MVFARKRVSRLFQATGRYFSTSRLQAIITSGWDYNGLQLSRAPRLNDARGELFIFQALGHVASSLASRVAIKQLLVRIYFERARLANVCVWIFLSEQFCILFLRIIIGQLKVLLVREGVVNHLQSVFHCLLIVLHVHSGPFLAWVRVGVGNLADRRKSLLLVEANWKEDLEAGVFWAFHPEAAIHDLSESAHLIQVDCTRVVLVEELNLSIREGHCVVIDDRDKFVCGLFEVYHRALLNVHNDIDVVGWLGDLVYGTDRSYQELLVHRPVQAD